MARELWRRRDRRADRRGTRPTAVSAVSCGRGPPLRRTEAGSAGRRPGV